MGLGRGGIAVCRHVPAAAEAREVKDGVDGGFDGASVALNLGEDEAALERGEEGNGEVVRVGAVREVPGGVKTEQPVADGSRPLPESGRDQGAGLRVGLGHLPGERAERAAAPALAALHLGDHHVPPGPEPLWAAEIGLPLVTGDGRGLVADDRLDKLIFPAK